MSHKRAKRLRRIYNFRLKAMLANTNMIITGDRAERRREYKAAYKEYMRRARM